MVGEMVSRVQTSASFLRPVNNAAHIRSSGRAEFRSIGKKTKEEEEGVKYK